MDVKFTSSFQLQLHFARSECIIMHLGNVVKYLLYNIFNSWARSTAGVIVLLTSIPVNVQWAQANSKRRQTRMNMSHCIQLMLPSSNGWKLPIWQREFEGGMSSFNRQETCNLQSCSGALHFDLCVPGQENCSLLSSTKVGVFWRWKEKNC